MSSTVKSLGKTRCLKLARVFIPDREIKRDEVTYRNLRSIERITLSVNASAFPKAPTLYFHHQLDGVLVYYEHWEKHERYKIFEGSYDELMELI